MHLKQNQSTKAFKIELIDREALFNYQTGSCLVWNEQGRVGEYELHFWVGMIGVYASPVS